jgi:DNA-binding XRE family transcriptional regulator
MNVATPAEKLSKVRPWRRAPRNKARRYGRWDCRIRQTREPLRLSLRTVAEAVGLSVTALHQIEHGGDPQLTTARKLAAFFGKSVEELWPKLTT